MTLYPLLLVADASVVLKWQLDDEECVPEATALRDDFYARGAIKVIAPRLLIYEVVNALVTAVRHGRIRREDAIEALGNLLALGIEIREVGPDKILEASLKYNVAAYDATYLALAEEQKCELWTGDRGLYQTVKDKLTWVRWVGDYRQQ